jgi:hypothetical protein
LKLFKKGEIYWESLPFTVYGAAALAASIFFMFFVPETKARTLSDTIAN